MSRWRSHAVERAVRRQPLADSCSEHRKTHRYADAESESLNCKHFLSVSSVVYLLVSVTFFRFMLSE